MLKRILLLCLFPLISMAEQPQSFVVGYYPHFQIEKYKGLIRDSYRDIGIDITFVEIPAANRGYRELNSSGLDAEVLRARKTALEYSNVVVIEPPLLEAGVFLICQENVPCDQSVINL